MDFPFERHRELIPVLIDQYAREEPEKIWAHQPVDDNDMSAGFSKITYRNLANAINHAARWMKSALPNTSKSFETIAYAGPRDVRYTIIAVAALKCQKSILICSPFSKPSAHAHLLKLSKCTTYIHSPVVTEAIDEVIRDVPHIKTIQVPDLAQWMADTPAKDFPYTKTWEQAKDDPWLHFHTSGTTGDPKLIDLNVENFHWAAIASDAPDLLPDELGFHQVYAERRFFIAIPFLHMAGMAFALQVTVFLGMELVLGPNTLTPRPSELIQLLRTSGAGGAIMPPSMIDDICREPSGVETLRGLWTIAYIGAQLSRQTAELLAPYTRLMSAMGSTETGMAHMGFNGVDDWEWYRFRKINGADFEKRSNNLYELVYRRKPEYEPWQLVFKRDRTIDEFRTNDLWTPHPTRADTWKYAGRADNMVKLAFGEWLMAAQMEMVVQEHPRVRAALIGGSGRMRPFLLVELLDRPVLSDAEKARVVEEIWPQVEKANEQVIEMAGLTRELVLFTSADRPLPLTAKETVRRKEALDLYAADIEEIYCS